MSLTDSTKFEEFMKNADEVRDAYMAGVVRDHGQTVACATEVFIKCSAAAKQLGILADQHKLSEKTTDALAELFELFANSMTATCFNVMNVTAEQAEKAFELNKHLLEQLSKVAGIHVEMSKAH